MTEKKLIIRFDLNNLTESNYQELMDKHSERTQIEIGKKLKVALDSHSISSEDDRIKVIVNDRIKVIVNDRVKIHLAESDPLYRLYMLDGKIPLVEVKALEVEKGSSARYGVSVTSWING